MRGGVTFEAGGRAYEIRFGNAALCAIEERSGKGVQEVLESARAAGSMNVTLRLLVWAGLGAKMALDEVSDLIDGIGQVEAERLVGKALLLAFPPPSAEGNESAAKA